MNPYISSQSCPRVFEFSFLYYLTSYDGMKLLALTPQVWQDVGEFFFSPAGLSDEERGVKWMGSCKVVSQAEMT